MSYNRCNSREIFCFLARNIPAALAEIEGSPGCPDLKGIVQFFPVKHGVIVVSDISGLPCPDKKHGRSIHAMHIHGGGSCTGDGENPFKDADGHYNPDGCPHPQHSGDLPPLFAEGGGAWSAVISNRFRLNEIIGKTVIIHSGADDFTSQPSGNSGSMIGCGVIRKNRGNC